MPQNNPLCEVPTSHLNIGSPLGGATIHEVTSLSLRHLLLCLTCQLNDMLRAPHHSLVLLIYITRSVDIWYCSNIV